jgi:thiosulfate dehydrogenase (quinone) large subunit
MNHHLPDSVAQKVLPGTPEHGDTQLASERTAAHRNALALSGLRVSVGLLFLLFGEYKVFGTQFTLHGGFQVWINRFLEQGAYPFMMPVLNHIVLPHGTAVAFLVAYGEFAIGLALVLGILVRTASAFGFIYMLSLVFSSNYPGTQAPFWQYFGASLDHSVLALCFLTFVFGHADRRLSVGNYFRKPRESNPTE